MLTTFANQEEAENTVKTLIEEKLIACAQLIEIKSKYVWEGKIEDAKEILCLLKTKEKLFEKIEKRIRELHSYGVPEIIMLKIEDGSREYLKWLEESIG